MTPFHLKLPEAEIFRLVGREGFERIVAGFYRRVATDDILGPMYPEDELPAAERRLKQYLLYRFGHDPTYIQERGHPRLRARHLPFPIDQTARDRWMKRMTESIDESDIDPRAREALLAFFDHLATFMINRR